MTSSNVRSKITEALRWDLIGPDNDHAFVSELLPQPPSSWYLTGFLVPSDASLHQKKDEEATDEIDSCGNGGGADDESPPDRAPAKHSFMPSSMGLSVLVSADVKQYQATVSWGDYTFESGANSDDEPVDAFGFISQGVPRVCTPEEFGEGNKCEWKTSVKFCPCRHILNILPL